MPTVTASTPMPRRPPIGPSQAASRFAAMGIVEDDDRPEEDRLLSTVHAGVRVVWRSVRCFGASEAAVAKHMHILPAKVTEYLLRADRAMEAQGEVASEVAERARARFPVGYVDVMRSCIEGPPEATSLNVAFVERPATGGA